MNIQIEAISQGANETNGNYILYKRLPDGSTLALLADGMGGLSFPDQASRIICESIFEYISKVTDKKPTKFIPESIVHADEVLNKACYQMKCRMGSALTLVYIKQDILYYAWLGDVRLYLKNKNGEISQLNKDDVIEIGKDSYLSSCIKGKGFRVPYPLLQIHLEQEDHLLLCSDGFYKHQNIENCILNGKFPAIEQIDDDCSAIYVEIY